MTWGLLAPSPQLYISSPSSVYSSSHSCSFPWSSNVVALRNCTSGVVKVKPRISLRCHSSTGPGGPSSPDENKTLLDAFFLGKALAEALNERIESTVGEVLSTIGRLQAEQLKQVQDFQEDVLERAKKSKEKAAREAIGQELIPNSSAIEVSTDAPAPVPSVNDAYSTVTTDEDTSSSTVVDVPIDS